MISRRWLFSGSSAPPATISSASCGEKNRFSRPTFSSWRTPSSTRCSSVRFSSASSSLLLQQLVVERLDAQERAHAREQLVLADRLGEEVVGAGVETLGALLSRVERGDEDDRQHRMRRIGADRRAHLVAAHAGHHHVEEDEVGALGARAPPAPRARCGSAGAIALRREQVGEQLDVHRDVVDDEDLGGVARGRSLDHLVRACQERLRDRRTERAARSSG